MVEDWKADADGILIFVRLYSLIPCLLPTKLSYIIDWSIFRCCRILDFSFYPGHSTESTGHLQFLPRQHLPDACRSKWIQHFEFPPCFTTTIRPPKLCSLGQCALVLELGNQPYLCSTCDAAAAMGTKVSQDHSVTLQPTQTSAYPCVLFRRRREVSPAMDRRNFTNASPRFPIPFLRRPGCVSMQR
jgi:hypothetical protein